ncbi:GGDEF domain-containing protein [Williamsia serinedens]|uniref:Diguanylate cyclase (GGDEF) domain-containing protein n=1 Tax=Williamsia serinedens TaxID=391736 RepID=A0ABT1H0N0_9NOCA|nr:GGDEF domain-containing protein [Williamsia serinedens]MCP2160539.1 diguanylate cyclase (GGDEF) domain-containing protein [Williamsia serinedens]
MTSTTANTFLSTARRVVTLLGEWWRDPVDHLWLRAFLESRALTAVVRVVVGVVAGSLTVAVLLMMASPAGPEGVVGSVVAITCAAIGVSWFVRWVVGAWPGVVVSCAFAVSADLAIGVASSLDADPMTGLSGALMLLVPGLYLTVFHGPRAVVLHAVFSATVVVVVLLPLVFDPPTDVPRAVAKGVMSASVLVVIPILSHMGWWLLREEAAESLVDPLTGLLNRRGLRGALLRRVVETPAGPGDALLAAVYDLDAFKAVNDRHGHDVGDRVLADVSRRVQAATPHLIHARLGGEEFAAVGFVDRREVESVAHRMKAAVAGAARPRVTASVGVVVVDSADVVASRLEDLMDGWMRRADVEMYAAKSRGGDTVSFAEE